MATTLLLSAKQDARVDVMHQQQMILWLSTERLLIIIE
jgi:hypothetical protein